MFQLPFGAAGACSLVCANFQAPFINITLDRIDNLVSVLVAIGSPALAGYSLAITRLNSRWLSRQFLYLHFPNKMNVPLAISGLQHIPFRIDTSGSLLPSLIVLPQNDRYWKRLGTAAKRTRQWSIPVAMNIVWALVALGFTIVDSFVDFDYFITVPGDAGYSIAAIWTYLLPVVVGWLYVGSQLDSDQLNEALNEAHEMAYVATATEPDLATRITGRSNRAIEPWTKYIDHVNADEKKTAPIFNYARAFIWSQHAEYILKLYQHAATKAEQRITVKTGGRWMSEEDDNIVSQDRIGNETEVVQYCMDSEATLRPRRGHYQFPSPFVPYSALSPSLPSLSKYDEETGATPEEPKFATEVFQRVVFATILALALQWGTTGAAVLIHLNTPPKGLGCRVLTFIIYGAAGTVSFWLLFLSSVLAHPTRRQSAHDRRSAMKMILGCIAALMRWLGKAIAIANGFGILVSCTMQFAGVYDNCFCSSVTFGGGPNGLVSFTLPDYRGSEVYATWIGGLVMAFGVSALYSFAIFLATPAK